MDAALSKLSLVLEFVDGVPLGAFVSGMHPHAEGPEARGPPASASARCLIVSDILNVLRYLHSRQPVIVHGDLKDSNVFVEERRGRTPGGQIWYHAKLLDFGLSRLVTRRAVPLGGTLRWMAPELLTGVAVPPAAAADLYSFGLLAYFIVTGRRPFEGASRDRVPVLKIGLYATPSPPRSDSTTRGHSQYYTTTTPHADTSRRFA
ncbi:unnamed protein product [Prorocentrum cordatum]|uniref:Protein kinase domain-containing protein n=1 Tax=Prorocentrum cordatum TaxID=2364126 RepID=A0ABN9PC91_9DINO|nr:unnamed protein product [Polarella glacialis]